MKRIASFLSSLLIIGSLSFISSCKDDDNNTPSGKTSNTTVSLTQDEEHDLLHLREEEKLARDVYLYTYDKYNLNLSLNISNSEQQHMDQVLSLLNKYGLDDPAHPDRGVFADSSLQALYHSLTTKVDSSQLDGLIVGAIIEDLDIADIQTFMQRTAKQDITNLYESLMCGSRNHLRSYYSNILNNNGTYSPQYITQAYFDQIINSANEQCGN